MDVAAELKVQVEIRQPEELKVLLIAVRCWDSLKSQTSLQRVIAAEVFTIEVTLELIAELNTEINAEVSNQLQVYREG